MAELSRTSLPYTINILDDGSVSNSIYFYDYYMEDGKYAAPLSVVGGWITDKECIGGKEGMIYRFHLNEDQSDLIFNWEDERLPLIPSVRERKNWNPVLSPEGERVAFLSALETGDKAVKLFTVSVDGGEPEKVETSYFFPENYSDSTIAVEILDWE